MQSKDDENSIKQRKKVHKPTEAEAEVKKRRKKKVSPLQFGTHSFEIYIFYRYIDSTIDEAILLKELEDLKLQLGKF